MIVNQTIAQRYEPAGLIDQDGPLQIYRGVDRRLARPVAIAVLDRNSPIEPRQVAAFLQRARKLAARPNGKLVGVHDVGEDHGLAYAVLDPMQGTTLSELLRRKMPIPLSTAIDLSVALAEAVEAAAELQLVDTIPDPRWIYLRESDRIKLGGLLFAGPEREPPPADVAAREQHIVQWLAILLVGLVGGSTSGDPGNEVRLGPMAPAGLKRLIERAIQPNIDDPLLTLRDWLRGLRTYHAGGQHTTAVVPRSSTG